MNSLLIVDIEPWFADGLAIRESPIHGVGLFADSGFPAGHDILGFGGYLSHVSKRYSEQIMPSTTLPLSEEIILSEITHGEKDFSDYINHSCSPNAGFRDALTLVAIKSLKPREEIVVDYTFWECDPKWCLKQPCNCGSEICRKQIKGTDWELVQPGDSRFSFYSPFVRRRIMSRIAIQRNK